ncbi:MAG: IPT/TIG domain-containing protein [Actinobacteria bacterium]|nr:IPT/TIG domain-containing protein [Actinomycetota bacterium]MCL6104089.1 IPT/TIG domain-containing protein [Actinomycetota bacterium]
MRKRSRDRLVEQLSACVLHWLAAMSLLSLSLLVSIAAMPPTSGFSQSSTGWNSQSVPSTMTDIYGISCLSTSVCVAVGDQMISPSTGTTNGAVLVTSDGGTTWATPTLPSGVLTFYGVNCVGSSNCWAVGENTSGTATIVETSDSGSTWASQPVSSGVAVLNSVACLSTTSCFAVGRSAQSGVVLSTSDGGTTWGTAYTASKTSGLNSISCNASGSVCVAVGAGVYNGNPATYYNDGVVLVGTASSGSALSWSTAYTETTATDLLGVSCSTATNCTAVGDSPNFHVAPSFTNPTIFTTSNGGSTWSVTKAPSDVSVLDSVSCFSSTVCFAGGAYYSSATAKVQPVIINTSDGGIDWYLQGVPTTSDLLSSIWCVNSSDCFAVGDVITQTSSGSSSTGGLILTTTDGGWGLPVVTGLTPSSGPTAGGTQVTIQGEDFIGTSVTVDFGTTPASNVTVVNPSTLTATVPAGAAGLVDVIVTNSVGSSSSSSADGYLYTTPGVYNPLTPYRVCDTRSGNPSSLSGVDATCNGHTLGLGSTPEEISVTVSGTYPCTTLSCNPTTSPGVPSTGATSVVLNITATNPTNAGFLTVWPYGVAMPLASSLNFVPNQTVANLVQVPLGPSGVVNIYNYSGSVDVIVDVEGWVGSSSSSTGGGMFHSITPTRICDTRPDNPSHLSGSAAQCNGSNNSGATLKAGSTLPVQVSGVALLPTSGITAVVLNVTVTDTAAMSYLSVWPSGLTKPTASNLNWTAGKTLANGVIVPLGTNGGISIYNNSGSADVVVDVEGYFTSSSSSSASPGYQFTPISPYRVCDTRPTSLSGITDGCTGHTLGAKSTLSVQVEGTASLPATGVASVVLNVTVTGTTANSYLTVFPQGTPPTASNLNWTAGETVPNFVTVGVSSSGDIVVYNYSGSVNVVVDVVGWYS